MKTVISFLWGTSASTCTMTLVPAVLSHPHHRSRCIRADKGHWGYIFGYIDNHQHYFGFIIEHTCDNIIYVEVKLRHLTIGIKVMALGGASHLDKVNN
jgi:hypothetical protein